ncbi:hypothetical protein [Reichenbachiella versicolor]|uniref:hypothetical protein n=1 Tax=Reichenbachiella versicolor TaxID=1821036 RepID=UPI0013A57091|nr:hypothetical protein [Reichenbachiella versicolor]
MSNNTGLECPKCSFKIKFTMETLLAQQTVICPNCQLKLDMNVPSEMKGHLQEIVLAEKMIKDVQKFSK